MTSRFETSMQKANEKILNQFKDENEIIFTPKSGEAFSTEAILGPIEGGIKDEETGEVLVKTRKITIPVPEAMVEFADGIAEAQDEDWVVDNVIGIESGMVDLQCRWIRTTSKHGEMHVKKFK